MRTLTHADILQVCAIVGTDPDKTSEVRFTAAEVTVVTHRIEDGRHLLVTETLEVERVPRPSSFREERA